MRIYHTYTFLMSQDEGGSQMGQVDTGLLLDLIATFSF